MRVTHFDRIEWRVDASTLVENADGSRTIDGFGAHVGPYTYHDDQGRPFIEHVTPDTLFEPASLDSAAGSTLTIRHGPGLVGPDQYRSEAHGSWVRAWDAGDGKLGARVRASSREALDFIDAAIASGDPVELSPVYEVDVVEKTTSDGKPALVQQKRRYSGIALLGPGEARGGPETRLQLDSKSRAPAGARVQVGARLDSGAHAPLHSETGRSNTMQQPTLSHGGREVAVTRLQLDALRSIAVRGDQIATTEIVSTSSEGETDTLVLPTAMWEMFLTDLGATSSPAEAPTEEVAEVETMEAIDADEDGDEKLDAKTVRRMISDGIAAHEAKRTKVDARDAAVRADAATILPPAYDFSVHWTQVALDAIAKVAPKLELQARKLSKNAKTDPEAAGMLRQMLAERRQSDSKTTTTIVTKGDGSGSEPWHAPKPPETKQ